MSDGPLLPLQEKIAGFDPERYRVDKFGIVIWRPARRSSKLAWAVDHFFPHSLGGLDALPNLCIISEAANYYKLDKYAISYQSSLTMKNCKHAACSMGVL